VQPQAFPPLSTMAASRALAVLLLALVATPAAALFEHTKSGVESLKTKEFEEQVIKGDDFWMIMFYAPWCGHCQKLEPDWKKAAKELVDVGRMGAVDCGEKEEEGLCGKYEIKGFPSIKVFGKDKEKPTDYNGGRDADSLVNFVKQENGADGGSASSKLVPPVNYLDMYEFIHAEKVAKVLVFPAEGKPTPSWIRMLASKYKDGKNKKIQFGEAVWNATDTKISQKFAIKETPCIQIVFAKHYTSYDGEFNKKELKEFLDDYVDMEEDVELQDYWKPVPSFPETFTPKKKVAPKNVIHLNIDNLANTCLKGTACIIALSGSVSKDGKSFDELDVMIELGKKYRYDGFNFAYVNAKKQDEFAKQLGVEASGLPTLAIAKGKTGKKTKVSAMPGASAKLDLAVASNFLDKIIGGDIRYKRLKTLEMQDDAMLIDDDEEEAAPAGDGEAKEL